MPHSSRTKRSILASSRSNRGGSRRPGPGTTPPGTGADASNGADKPSQQAAVAGAQAWYGCHDYEFIQGTEVLHHHHLTRAKTPSNSCRVNHNVIEGAGSHRLCHSRSACHHPAEGRRYPFLAQNSLGRILVHIVDHAGTPQLEEHRTGMTSGWWKWYMVARSLRAKRRALPVRPNIRASRFRGVGRTMILTPSTALYSWLCWTVRVTSKPALPNTFACL